jgi:aldehyde dehydrogenase (NAD+)
MEIETRNLVAGEWVDGKGHVENVNPSDVTDVICRHAQADGGQLDDAVAAARIAQRNWWDAGIQKRHDVLMAIGTALMGQSTEIGALLSREEGKPLAEGKGEVYRAGQFFTYFAAEALRQIGDFAQSVRPGIEIDVRREPVGVIGIVSPWNFPVATPAWKIAPALAFGNAVVWKPANLTPSSAAAMARIISEQDIPPGLLSMLAGPGREIGQKLVEHPGVDAISFTGSVAVGRGIAASATARMAKVQLEMGSKNPMLIMDDADIDFSVAHAANAAFGGTGQKCTAASRLIVHESVYDEFVDKLALAASKLRVGHALEEGTQMGPTVSDAQLSANLAYVEKGMAEGAELVFGGGRLERPTTGHFMEPTVFAGTSNDMVINREEMFAPITCVIKSASYDEALSIANDSEFGLTAGIMTKSLARANHFCSNMRAGTLMVNLPTAGTDYHVPFGGRGASSFGPREQGQYAVEFYSVVKTAYVHGGAAT